MGRATKAGDNEIDGELARTKKLGRTFVEEFVVVVIDIDFKVRR